jgi:hypothetical protein
MVAILIATKRVRKLFHGPKALAAIRSDSNYSHISKCLTQEGSQRTDLCLSGTPLLTRCFMVLEPTPSLTGTLRSGPTYSVAAKPTINVAVKPTNNIATML